MGTKTVIKCTLNIFHQDLPLGASLNELSKPQKRLHMTEDFRVYGFMKICYYVAN